MNGCFITGTDTDAGKTTVCAALLRMLLTAQVDRLLTEARHLGFDRDTVMELIEKRLTRHLKR